MQDERIKRPELERNGPVRDWYAMFERSGSNGQPHEVNGPEPADRSGGGAERDVSMGYRVIEEYMRRGAAAARDMSQVGAEFTQPAAASMLFDRLLQSASDLGVVWLEMLQTLWTAQAPHAAERRDPGGFELRREAQPAPAERSAPSAASAQIAFRVQGGRDVELSATLLGELGAGPFVVHDLRALQAEQPRLRDVRFELQDAPTRGLVTLSIAPDQPPGVYSGLLVDANSNLPLATISVRVL